MAKHEEKVKELGRLLRTLTAKLDEAEGKRGRSEVGKEKEVDKLTKRDEGMREAGKEENREESRGVDSLAGAGGTGQTVRGHGPSRLGGLAAARSIRSEGPQSGLSPRPPPTLPSPPPLSPFFF